MTQAVRPEGRHTLLLGAAHDAVHDALVLLVGCDLLAGVTVPAQQFYPLHRGHSHLGDGGGNASGQEVLGKGEGLFRCGGRTGSSVSGKQSGGTESWRVSTAGQPCCRRDRKCRPGIPYKMVYCQGIYFRLKDVSEWAHEHGILWYHTFHHPAEAHA